MENVVSAPRVMSSCLPMATTSISLVGLLSRSTMLPASLAAIVPVFMATPTSAWASAGASLVPSPVMATRRPPACSFLMRSSLSLGVAWARKSSTPASRGDGRGGERVVAGDHHRADAHGPQLGEALPHAAFDDVLEVDDAEHAGTIGHRERRAAGAGDPSAMSVTRCGKVPPCSITNCRIASVAPLRMAAAIDSRRRSCGCGRRRG